MSGAVPKLRFPQFKEEWVARRVSEMGEVITGATPDTAREDFYGGNVPFYSPGDIPEVPALIDAASKMLTDAGLNSVRRVPKGASLFVCIGSTIGKVAFAGAAGATNQQINSVVPSSVNDPYFVFLTLQKVARRIRQFAGTQAVPIINKSEFSNEVVFSTTLPEQQKIASFLGAVDVKISGLRRKEAALVRFKAGLMQKLFSQKIRFTRDDGSAFPDWDFVPFEEAFMRVKRKNLAGVQNVLTISAQHGLVSQTDFFSKSVAATDLSNYYHLMHGDFAYNRSYSNGYPMGAIKRLKMYDEGVVSALYICFAARVAASAPFFEQYFDSGLMNAEIGLIAQEGARNHGLLNVSVVDFFEQITVPLPHPDEQRRIAGALTALDDKIAAVRSQISKMETFKKGLLQQMFV